MILKERKVNIMAERKLYVTDGEYMVYPIAEEDRENYVELHRQINGENTLYLNSFCKEELWKWTLSGTDKVFSIFDAEGNYCGSVELQNPTSRTPEIGIDLLECKRNLGIASKVIKMFARHTYQKGNIDYFIIRISSKNSHSRHVFEKMGVIPIGEDESGVKSFMKNFKEVVGDSNNLEDRLKKFFMEEEEVIYKYKLVPKLFM